MYRYNISFRKLMVTLFSGLFFIFAFAIAILSLQEFWNGLGGEENITGAFIRAINSIVVALATFELGAVVSKEYGSNEKDHIVIVLRRTLPRFVSITCIALVLEGLLLVIKYSQMELAGNLYYPVAIICAASFLLIALGIFLRFSILPEASPKMETHSQQDETLEQHYDISSAYSHPHLHFSKTIF
jgi:hypothetical protein